MSALVRLGSVSMAFALSTTFAGCSAARERDDDAGTDAHRIAPPLGDGGGGDAEPGLDARSGGDVGVSPRPVDAGSITEEGGVLPEEPDPDRGPDSRPSDYVELGAWGAPPDIAPDDPCCTLGETFLVTSRDEGMALSSETPSIVWGPGVWGLLATRYFVVGGLESDPRQVVYELAADGTPLGDPRVLETTSVEPSFDDGVIAWAEGRWAVAVSVDAIGGDVREWSARLFDRDFRPATEWMPVGPARVRQLAVARLTVGAHWEAVRDDGASIRGTPFSGAGSEAEVAVDPRPGSALSAVGMRSRLAVLIARQAPESSTVVVTAAPPDAVSLGTVELHAGYGMNADAAALRDLVVVAGSDGTEARVEIVDPFATRVVGDVLRLGPAQGNESVARGAIDVVGSSTLGVAGVCWGSGGGDGGRDVPSAIDFRLVGPDGLARGTAVRVIEAPFRGGRATCSVGTDDAGFVVSWWDGSSLWVRRIDVAAH